jgi:hypothetical protein
MGDKQKAHWWSQFRHIISLHQHELHIHPCPSFPTLFSALSLIWSPSPVLCLPNYHLFNFFIYNNLKGMQLLCVHNTHPYQSMFNFTIFLYLSRSPGYNFIHSCLLVNAVKSKKPKQYRCSASVLGLPCTLYYK